MFSVETTASHQKSTAAKECDSPAANGVTEHEKLTSHVFNLHPKNSTRSLRLSSDLNGGASCTYTHKNSFILAENQIRVSGVPFWAIFLSSYRMLGNVWLGEFQNEFHLIFQS